MEEKYFQKRLTALIDRAFPTSGKGGDKDEKKGEGEGEGEGEGKGEGEGEEGGLVHQPIPYIYEGVTEVAMEEVLEKFGTFPVKFQVFFF